MLGLVAAPLAADAQSTGKSYRVGLVSLGSVDPSLPGPWWQPFRDAMRELGYIEGTNLVFRVVAPAGQPERMPSLIAEVARLGVDVFVTTSTRETRAVMDAVPTIPVVMTLVPDPVAQGFAKSLGRPGGNVTGMTNLVPGLSQKYLELLKEAVPRLTKVAVIARPRNATIAETRPELEAAATALRLGLAITSVRSAGDIHASAADFEEVLTRAKREGAGGFIAVADPLTYFNRRHLVHAAMRIGLPGMYWSRDYVEDGGKSDPISLDIVSTTMTAAKEVDEAPGRKYSFRQRYTLRQARKADFPGGRMVRGLAAIASSLVVVLAGCTSVGLHSSAVRTQVDFGAADTVSLCLYLDEGVSERHARELVEEAWRDDAPLYGLQIKVASVTRGRRPAFTMDGIIDALIREPLTPECDRILALIGRHLGDIVWGLLLPEYLGAVNDETLTHGYVIAQRASLNQLFDSPRSVTRHEIYHLLGCDEHFKMNRCYEQIALLKGWKQAQRSDFFPAWDMTNKLVLPSREAVNARLRAVVDGRSNLPPQ